MKPLNKREIKMIRAMNIRFGGYIPKLRWLYAWRVAQERELLVRVFRGTGW